MSDKKPIPAAPEVARKRCPVCDKAVYSASGIHPQCALSRESAEQFAAQKAAREAAPAAVAAPAVKPAWLKTCPVCKRQSPSRRFACECGHKFASAPR
ncbi:MAG: hypothetical protein KF708_20155 [Pirellulales bacterium]|nr:hypothetical protein [Pirellulales bacterium]